MNAKHISAPEYGLEVRGVLGEGPYMITPCPGLSACPVSNI